MKSIHAYRYRWIVLLALMLVTIASQVQWLALAPVSRAATAFYQTQIPSNSFINPDILTLIHMMVFVIISIPASYFIDRNGLKVSLRAASLCVALCSLVKGLGAGNFWVVIIAQIGLAVAYPVVLNSVTAVTTRWFPLRERGFATGLASVAQYLGIFLVMLISPRLVSGRPQAADYGNGIGSMLFWYGAVSAAVCIVSFFLFQEKPPTPSSAEGNPSVDFKKSIGVLYHKKHLVGLMMVFGFIWGLFNAFISKTDGIAALIGVENSNGLVGVVLLFGGMLGSMIIPALSDFYRKRKLFFCICIAGLFIGSLVFAFIPDFAHRLKHPAALALISAGILGFFFMSIGPLGFQYASELSYPVPESSSQGVLLLFGNACGVLILFFMNLAGGMYLEKVLIVSVALLSAAFLAALYINESPIIITEEERLREAVNKEIVHLE